MAGGVIALPNLKYTVPGAEIDLNGTYGVDGGTLNFKGTAQMQATVSQMVGGWKGILLKPADRLFKKNGAGTEVPIHVDGTEQDPMFGVDFGQIGHTRPKSRAGPARPSKRRPKVPRRATRMRRPPLTVDRGESNVE